MLSACKVVQMHKNVLTSAKSGLAESNLNSLAKLPLAIQLRNRLLIVCQVSNSPGRSRHGTPLGLLVPINDLTIMRMGQGVRDLNSIARHGLGRKFLATCHLA